MATAALPAGVRGLVAASALTNLSDGVRMVSLPLLAAAATRDPRLVAAVFVAGQLPWLVLGLPAGAATDRFERRRLLRWVTAVRSVLPLLLAVLVLAETAPIGLVILAAAALGAGEVLSDTVSGALVPMLVDSDQLETANSRLVAGEVLGDELLGPALGGVLFAVAASLPFYTNAGLLAVALIFLAVVPRPAGAEVPTSNLRRPVTWRAAFQLIADDPLLSALTWSSALLAAVDGAWFALLVLFVGDTLGLGSAAFGLLLAVGALGVFVGAWAGDRYRSAVLPVIARWVFGIMGLSLLALAVAPSPVATAMTLMATSGSFAAWNVFVVSARQRSTTLELMGRVGAIFRTVVVAAAILGAAAGGFVASASSIRVSLAAGGLIVLIGCAAVPRSLRAVD